MQRIVLLALVASTLALNACSSDMNSGMAAPGGMVPPVQQGVQQPGGLNPAAGGVAGRPGQPSPTPTAPPGNTATYAFSDAGNGIRCPDVDGYSCIIHLNVPVATPSPKPGTHPTATPPPSPSPSASASGSPSPTPSSTPAITIALQAQPHDAPAMVNPGTKPLSATPLVALRLSTNQDITLKGTASADFILPQGQLGGREFALQLFRETTAHHNRHVDTFLGSYAESTLSNDTLHFAITPPQVTVRRDETWLLVLYANEKPLTTLSSSPKPSPSPSPSASPTVSPSSTP
jgi:hypothetical protein